MKRVLNAVNTLNGPYSGTHGQRFAVMIVGALGLVLGRHIANRLIG
jgi:hypothetical protein